MGNLIATSLEVLLIPGCCKRIDFGCYYTVPDFRTLLKKGLCLVCPHCHKTFSTSRPLFDVLSLLNFRLIDTNDTLGKTKKSGFLSVVELSSDLHPYILKIIKPYLDIDLQFSDIELPFSKRTDLEMIISILSSSTKIGDKAFVEFPHREFRITRLMFNCRTCGNTFPSNVFSDRSGRVICNPCGNRQRFPKRRIDEIQRHVDALNVAVSACLRQGLLVVPVPRGWQPNIL